MARRSVLDLNYMLSCAVGQQEVGFPCLLMAQKSFSLLCATNTDHLAVKHAKAFRTFIAMMDVLLKHIDEGVAKYCKEDSSGMNVIVKDYLFFSRSVNL